MLKTVSSVANALGALNYKGTWNANTNTPALASGVGTKGDYYVVSVAGATNLDGITNWGVGDWATFNGSVWQRVEGGADGNFVNLDVTGTANLDVVDIDGAVDMASTLQVDGAATFSSTIAGTALYSNTNGNTTTGGNLRIGLTTNNTTKYTAITSTQYAYDTESEGFTLISATAADATANSVVIGGGIDEQNAATAVRIFTGTATTRTGAERLKIDATGNLTFNENGADADFRVESDGNANMLFVDGGNNAVGIGMASPTQALSIGGGLTVTASATLPSALGSMTFSYESPVNRMYIGDGSGYSLAISKRASSTTTNLLTLSDNGSLQTYPSAGQDAFFNENGIDADFRVESDTDANALVVDGGTGNVGVGSAGLTSTGPIATSAVGAAVTSFKSVCVAGDQTATNLILQSARTDVYYHMQAFVSGSTEVFRIEASGNVKNTNNSYGALSDAKLKENIVDASPKLADLMQVKVRNYNLIGGTTKQIGVVAQELEAVFPSMVDENADRDEDGNLLETTTKGVKYSVFVPMLIKAIQEQQTLIESLTARITALES